MLRDLRVAMPVLQKLPRDTHETPPAGRQRNKLQSALQLGDETTTHHDKRNQCGADGNGNAVAPKCHANTVRKSVCGVKRLQRLLIVRDLRMELQSLAGNFFK